MNIPIFSIPINSLKCHRGHRWTILRRTPSPPKICFLPSTTVQKNTLKALVPHRSRGFFVFLRHCRTIKFKRQLGCGLPSAARLSSGKQQTIFQESCSTRPVQTAAIVNNVSHISIRCDCCRCYIFWLSNVLRQIFTLIFLRQRTGFISAH